MTISMAPLTDHGDGLGTASQSSQAQAQAQTASSLGHRKYQSPPPPPNSMTPPPSSQTAGRQSLITAVARTPTPTHSHLSSPPPTTAMLKPSISHDGTTGVFSPEQIADANIEELRGMLSDSQQVYREARAAAAHKTLQYNLLHLETTEAINRMSVELSMSRKEVEVLHTAYSGQSMAPIMPPRTLQNPPVLSPSDDQTMRNLRERMRMLELENEELRMKLGNAKTLIFERESVWHEENDRLRRRIRENREHFNLILRSNNIERVDIGGASNHGTPSRARQNSAARPRHEESIAQLLLADRVLSQEAASSPSTPQPRRPQHTSHSRNSHSLSSLPSTPMHARTAPPAPRYNVYDHASPAQAPYRSSAGVPVPLPPPSRQRRDSTISASDSSDEVNSDADITASQASQEAANLLRRSAGSSFHAANHPPTPVSATKPTGMHQTKLFGQISKPSVTSPSKRKVSDIHESPRSKKARSEGLGLGIGGWAGR